MRPWRILKSEQQYAVAVAALLELEDCPDKTKEQLEEMELLSLLVEQYKKAKNESLPGLPDPIEAIDFRLEQRGLKRKDLSCYIGSASKISEVMNRKIPLSLQMIRALNQGLDIPADVLLGDTDKKLSDSPYLPKDYPFAEMLRRGYFAFSGTLAKAKDIGEELLEQFFSVMPDFELNTCYRKTNNSTTDNNAIKAWQCHVIHRAMEEDLPVFKPGNFDDVSYKELARLSQYKAGPQIAAELLRGEGIHLVYAQHLPHTRLDGAAFLLPDGHPVIAMTLRYDRLDNYWFTLFHELHHVLHDLPNHANAAFMDDTENPNDEEIAEMERNADIAARNVLIPPEVWNDEKVQALLGTNNSEIVKKVAFEKRISSAVLAGRLRKESNKYYLFQDLLGKCRAQLMSEENNETDNKKQEV